MKKALYFISSDVFTTDMYSEKMTVLIYCIKMAV